MSRLALVLMVPVVAAAALAHGGRYRVPVTGQQPSPMAPGGFEDRTGATQITDSPKWSFWLDLEIDRLLDLRGRLAGDPAAESRPAGAPTWRPLTTAEKTETLLPPLLKALRDQDPEVRASAAIALGKLAVPGSLAPLLAATEDRDKRVRASVSLALGMTGIAGAEAPLVKILADTHKDETHRAWSAIGLGFLGTENGADQLLRRLEVDRGEERDGRAVLVACAAGLTVSRDAGAVPRILAILKRADGRLPPAQALLLLALGKLQARTALPVIESALKASDHIVRAGAAAAAGRLATAADDTLVTALCATAESDAHPGVRAQAMIALGRAGGARAHAVLRRLADVQKKGAASDLRPFAATALALVGDKTDTPLLLASLEETTSLHKGAFALALARLGDPAAEKQILAELKGAKNPAIFAHVALAAGVLRARSCVDFLRKALADQIQIAEYRTAAAVALAMCGDGTGVQLILRELGKSNPAGEQAPLVFAAYLLACREAVPQLVALMGRSDVQDRIRALCCVALGSIGDTRRHPVMSDLTGDFPMMVITEDLDRVLSLY